MEERIPIYCGVQYVYDTFTNETYPHEDPSYNAAKHFAGILVCFAKVLNPSKDSRGETFLILFRWRYDGLRAALATQSPVHTIVFLRRPSPGGLQGDGRNF